MCHPVGLVFQSGSSSGKYVSLFKNKPTQSSLNLNICHKSKSEDLLKWADWKPKIGLIWILWQRGDEARNWIMMALKQTSLSVYYCSWRTQGCYISKQIKHFIGLCGQSNRFRLYGLNHWSCRYNTENNKALIAVANWNLNLTLTNVDTETVVIKSICKENKLYYVILYICILWFMPCIQY